MKRKFCKAIIMIFCSTSLSSTVFAYEEKVGIPEYYMQNPYGCRGIVTLDDIRSLGEGYQNGNILKKEYAGETLYPYLDKTSVDFYGKDNESDSYYCVKDTDSLYSCFCYDADGQISNYTGYPYLKAQFMEYGIDIDGNMEKLTEYIESSKEIYEQVYGKVAYIKEHLDDSQHGGYYYEMDDSKVHIYLSDSSKKKELEEEGIVCEEAEYSLSQMNKKMDELWDRRQELGIYYMEVFDNQVVVTVENEEEAKELFADDPMIYISNPSHWLQEIMGRESLDTILEYLEDIWFYKDEEKYSELAAALEKLKEAYPEYDYVNLFYHVVKDFDYERYLDFPEELCEYVDQLPPYQKTNTFMDEIEFGDPLRLEVKRMLREYKRKYPDMSYPNIYETYIKEIEEDSRLSSGEKLCRYLYDKYTMVFENEDTSAQEDTLPTAVFGSVVLLIGGIIVCIKKKIY